MQGRRVHTYAPSKIRTLLISLEMENSSMHAMRAAARDTGAGATAEGSTRPEVAQTTESIVSCRWLSSPRRSPVFFFYTT